MKDFTNIINLCKQSDGGATVDRNGKEAKGLYFASIYPQFEFVTEPEKLNNNVINQYIENVNDLSKGLLNQENTYLGFWNNPKNNKVYLDISKSFDNIEKVKKACKEHNQLAYFDTNKGESIAV